MNDAYVPTKQDILAIDILPIINNCDQKACEYYGETLYRYAETVENETEREAIYFIAAVTSFMFDLDNYKNPFEKPKHVWGDKRSMVLLDLNEDQISLIKDVYPDIKDDEIQARFADVVWVLKKDRKAARTAIEAYKKSAKVLEHPEHWTLPLKRIKRAMQIAKMLGKSNEQLKEMVNYVQEVLERMGGKDPLYFSGKLMELLLDLYLDDDELTKYALLAKEMAESAEEEKDFNKAKYYWEVSAKWLKRQSNVDVHREMLCNAAETMVKEAEMDANNPDKSFLASAIFIDEAIQYYRGLPGSKEIQKRILELRGILKSYQGKSVNEMEKVETKMDLTDIAKNSIKSVSGKNINEALLKFANIAYSPNLEELREQAERSISDNPLTHIVEASLINEDGHVIAKKPSALSSDPSEIEQTIRIEMYEHLRMHQQITALGCIKPALDQILSEHKIDKDTLKGLIHGKHFIPDGRENIFIEGLLAGFKYELLYSTHILIPQLENSIRNLLYQCGALPHGYDGDGVQEEYNLNKLLYMKEVQNIFGEDLTFDLQGLLIEKYCSNLRNNMAHGLMDYESFQSPSALYLWWITLHVILGVEEKEVINYEFSK